MTKTTYDIGDLVKIMRHKWSGSVGIVSLPISEHHKGHVLIHKESCIIGLDASIEDVEIVDESNEGFAQLGYHLIKLGSHVIEQKLII